MSGRKFLGVCSLVLAAACGSSDDVAGSKVASSGSAGDGVSAQPDSGSVTMAGSGGGGGASVGSAGGGSDAIIDAGGGVAGGASTDAAHPTMFDPRAATPIGDQSLPRKLYIENHCSYAIWNYAQPQSTFPGGVPLEIDAGQAFAVGWSDNFSGRVWGRSGCTGTGSNLKCAQTRADSLAEFTLTRGMGSDWYDVSLVDGFTIPMGILQIDVPFTLSGKYVPGGPLGPDNICGSPICAADLNPACPAAQQQKDAMGNVVGCVNGLKGPSPGTKYFKDGCPTSYTWDFDDPQSLFRCPSAVQNGGKGAKNYALIYCPTEGPVKGFP